MLFLLCSGKTRILNSKIARRLLRFVVFSLSLSGYLVFSKYFRFNVLVGCGVPRLDLLQVICSTTTINFNYDTISSLLALTFANIKSYRGALYTYKINMMNSIQPLLNNYLPMSLVPRQALLAILDDVASEQWRKSDRLSLAIPMDEIIAYYESQLLRDV